MRRLLCALALAAAASAPAVLAAQTQTAQPDPSGSGACVLVESSDGWVAQAGDDPAWARPDFDDRAWKPVNLDDLGAAQSGWHWFRKRIVLGPDHDDASLLLEGGDGTYELYVNASRVSGASLRSAFNVYRPTERVFDLHDANGVFTIALRTHAPANYAEFRLPLFLSATLGTPSVVEYERADLQQDRLDGVWPSIAINLLLCVAAICVLCLYLGQRGHREYFYLGLYLFVLGLSNGLANLQQAGIAPTSLNMLVADPLIYVYTILQIEFTFSFVGKRPNIALRIYEAALLLPWIFAWLCWTGRVRSDTYALIEAAITIPVAFILTVLLLVWYRRGNREAGWLIFPSLLPLTMGALFDFGFASMLLGWRRFDFLDSAVPIGQLSFPAPDLADLLFLIAIAVVMFFRFTRVSREQARAAAELDAAREIQQALVPSSLPLTAGCRIEAAYLPAQEVGGDFYQVVEQSSSTLIVIGDVSGKGLRAAMTGTLAVGVVRALAAEEMHPSALLTALNRRMPGIHDGGFITCLCLEVGADGRVLAANAGHLPPYRNNREIVFDSGFPIGVLPNAEYKDFEFTLAPGDTLTLLSDGVVEARNQSGELFGFDRTAALSAEPAARIAAAAQSFGQEDDITVLTLTLSS